MINLEHAYKHTDQQENQGELVMVTPDAERIKKPKIPKKLLKKSRKRRAK